MKRTEQYAKEHPIGLAALILLGMGLLIGLLWTGAMLVATGGGLGTVAKRVERCQLLESSLALENAEDGTYLVYALLRGDQVLYDDDGRAVLYLQEERSTKQGTRYDTIFSAQQFYLDGLAVERPSFHTLYYPDFDEQYGRNTYKGLWHCQWGTFLVDKVENQYKGVTFFPEWQPQRVLEKYEPEASRREERNMLIGSLADILICAAGIVLVALKTTRKYACPKCGQPLKKNEQCKTCLEYAVRLKEKPRQTEETETPRQEVQPTPPKPMSEKERRKMKREWIIGAVVIALLIWLFVLDGQRQQRIASSGNEATYAYRPVISENVFHEYPYTVAEENGYTAAGLDSGEPVQLRLTAGVYIVGVHIPEGRYTVTADNPYDLLYVQDYAHQIYLYEYEAKEPSYFSDVRLYNGALVEAQTETGFTLQAEHARTDRMRSIANPLTQTVTLPEGTAVAGEAFPEGIYDLRMGEGECSVEIIVPNPIGGGNVTYRLEKPGDTWANMVLPANTQVTVTGSDLTLTPSERIFSTYYPVYYEMY